METRRSTLAAAVVCCNLLPAAARLRVKVLETGNNDEILQPAWRR